VAAAVTAPIQHTLQDKENTMLKFKRVTVKKSERGLLLRNGDFQRVLQPGTHWLFTGLDALRVETFALEQAAFTHGLADYLMAREPAVVAAEFVRVELAEHQVGLRCENGVLVEVLAPGTRRLYWKGLVDVQVEVIDIGASAGARTRHRRAVGRWQGRSPAGAGIARVLEVQPPGGGGAGGPAPASA
jgi:regulator of protease activity HflC (stomatin/prohibitin superfamily)